MVLPLQRSKNRSRFTKDTSVGYIWIMSNQCRHIVLKEEWVWKLLRYGTVWLGSQGVFWKPDMRQGAAMEVREEVTRSKDLMETFHGRIERWQGRRGMLTQRKKFKVQKE